MNMPERVRCGDCRFWQERDDNPLGTCHFDPPVLIKFEEEFRSEWPETVAAAWCGKAERSIPAPIQPVAQQTS